MTMNHERKSTRRLTLLAVLLLGGVLGSGAFWGWQHWQASLAVTPATGTPQGGRQILYYRNPMGLPDTSATPKKDAMGMPYVPVYADEAAPSGSASVSGVAVERRVLYYRNPMGLPDTSATPKKDEMGMPYVPVYADEAGARSSATVTVSPDRIQSLGVTTEPVRQEALQRTLRAVGQLTVDERNKVTIAPKFGGWIERLPVNTTGQSVRAGETLLDVYSPELIAAQQEYLLAKESQARLQLEPAMAGGKRMSLSEGALQRLRFWDIPEAELQRLAHRGEVRRTLSLTAPSAGVVLTKNAVQGMRFEAGQPLFELADLSHLWLLADIFEQDLNLVRVGQSVAIQVAAYPGEKFYGRIAFIYPTLNAQTRTVPVRIELDNRDGRLKPAMYGEAQLRAAVAPAGSLTIPESALIDTGTRQVVLVSQGEGRFTPREVEVGAHGEAIPAANTPSDMAPSERRVVVLRGLQPGEAVVTRANFLLDSESNLRAAFAGLVPAVPSAAVATDTVAAGGH
jgi:membrane fusion protein, copper/silver efflux system